MVKNYLNSKLKLLNAVVFSRDFLERSHKEKNIFSRVQQ